MMINETMFILPIFGIGFFLVSASLFAIGKIIIELFTKA